MNMSEKRMSMKKLLFNSGILLYCIHACLSSCAVGIGKCEYCQYPDNLHEVDSKFVCDKHYCAKHDLIRPPLQRCKMCVLESGGLGKSKCVICGSREQLMIRRWLDGGEHTGTEYVVVCPYDYCDKHRFVRAKHDFTRKGKTESEIYCKLCHDEMPKLKKNLSRGSAVSVNLGEDTLRYMVSISAGNRDAVGVLLKMDGQVYLYTSWAAVYSPYPIVAKDYLGKCLRLGDFELCEGRGLVRFGVGNVPSGLTLARMDKLSNGTSVVAYDNTLIHGRDFPNLGRILSVSSSEIDVQLDSQSNGFGSLLVNSDCDVIGIIPPRNYASEKGKDGCAIRLDSSSWVRMDKENFRKSVSRLQDVRTVFQELDGFYRKIDNMKRLTYISRADERERMYKDNSGYSLGIKSVYESWGNMMNGLDQVANMSQAKTFQDLFTANGLKKKSHLNYRWATVSVPSCIMTHATNSLAAIKAPCFSRERDLLGNAGDTLFKYIIKHKGICALNDRSDAEEYQRICEAWEPVRKEIERKLEAQRERERVLDELEQRIERNAAVREQRMRNAIEDAQDETRRQVQNMNMQRQLEMNNMQMQQQLQMQNFQTDLQMQLQNFQTQMQLW